MSGMWEVVEKIYSTERRKKRTNPNRTEPVSDNTLVCIVITAMIGGCTTCSVSTHRTSIEKLRLEHEHNIELLKATPKP